MRRAARSDTTQGPIVDALRKVGAKVRIIQLPCDLLVLYRGTVRLMDTKTGKGKRGRFTKTAIQVALEAEGWPVSFPRTPDEALTILGVVR